jgi:hypothetical protein
LSDQTAPVRRMIPAPYMQASIPETFSRIGATNAWPIAVPKDPNKLSTAATVAIAAGVATIATVALIAGDVTVAMALARKARKIRSTRSVPKTIGTMKQSAAISA